MGCNISGSDKKRKSGKIYLQCSVVKMRAYTGNEQKANTDNHIVRQISVFVNILASRNEPLSSFHNEHLAAAHAKKGNRLLDCQNTRARSGNQVQAHHHISQKLL